MEIIKVGIIGMGGRGRGFFRSYRKESFDGFEAVAVCDLDQERLAVAREMFGQGMTCYTDMHEMLRREDLQLVIVATHDRDHVEPTLAALRAGKHVLVEKPLCQSVEEARLIVAEASRADGMFFMGFELREVTVFRQMKEFIDEGKIGRIRVAHVFDNVGYDFNAPYFRNPQRQTAYYRSLLLQKASHSLDLLNWFTGSRPVKVYGTGGLSVFGYRNQPGSIDGLRCGECDKGDSCPFFRRESAFCVWNKFTDLNDHSELTISYANGINATFHENYFTPEYTREFWLVGTRGKMYGYYDNPGRFLIRITNLMPARERYERLRDIEEYWPVAKPGGHGGGDLGLRDEVYRRIVENDPPSGVIESAYYSTALGTCGEDSIKSGMPVEIPALETVR